MNSAVQSVSSGPWWKYGHMWLVVGGPLVVVVASFITLYLAVSRPDPVYADAPGAAAPGAAAPRAGVRAQQPVDEHDPALTPAMQARNHAASPASGQPLQGAAPARQPGHP